MLHITEISNGAAGGGSLPGAEKRSTLQFPQQWAMAVGSVVLPMSDDWRRALLVLTSVLGMR